MNSEPIIVECTYNSSIEKLWQAITIIEQMKDWYFDVKKFKPEEGFEFSFTGTGHMGESYLHLCKITEVDPCKKLQYSWAYEGYPGKSYVTFELSEKDFQTHLKLTHKGVDSFPENNPDFARSSWEGGWDYLIGKQLKKFVEDR